MFLPICLLHLLVTMPSMNPWQKKGCLWFEQYEIEVYRKPKFMQDLSPTDAELVRLVLAGKKEHFKLLVERYQQKIFAYLYRFLYQDRDTAEDLTQTVFLKAYKNLASFNMTLSMQSWLYRIAHNEAANHFRSLSRRKETKLEDAVYGNLSDPNESDLQAEKEDRQQVQLALAQLKVTYREVIILHYFEDKSYEEIAEILKSPVSTVGTLLRRAKQKVAKILQSLEP